MFLSTTLGTGYSRAVKDSRPTPPAERADARANRQRLLDAAVAVFAERGAEAEIREIAERAGLAVGTVYNHFPSKEDLLAAVVEEAAAQFEAALDTALAEADVVEALRSFVRRGLHVAERFGSVMAAALEGQLPAMRATAAHRARRTACKRRIVDLFQRGVSEGRFRPGIDAEVAAAMLGGVFTPWTFAELRRSRTPEQITATLLDALLHGIERPRPEEPAPLCAAPPSERG